MLAVDVVVLAGAVLDPVPGDELLAGAKLAADVGKVVANKSVKSKINNAITNCFTAGTRIQTADGEKNIEDIKVGDKVLSKDDKTGKQKYKEVTQLFRKQVDTIYEVHVGKEKIKTTAEHPFWVKGKGWVKAKDLKVADQLENDKGKPLTISRLIRLEKHTVVYNFEVVDYHTYYVSKLHLWVHNKCGDTLYHYTTEEGMNGIVSSRKLNPSLKAHNPKDARYGDGQYLSDIVPGTKTPAQLSKAFINLPYQGKKFNHFVEIDVTGLDVVKGREGVFVIPNSEPLDIANRLIRFGRVPN